MSMRMQETGHKVWNDTEESDHAGLIWVKPSEKAGEKAAGSADTSDIPILPEIDVRSFSIGKAY